MSSNFSSDLIRAVPDAVPDELAEAPRISMIVCSRNRDKQLGRCIASIAAEFRSASPGAYELIVIDSASQDSTWALLNELSGSIGIAFTACHLAKPGLSRARNRGMELARGNVLAFTDDDCVIVPGYFNALEKAWANRRGAAILGGRVSGAPADLPITLRTETRADGYTKGRNPAGFIQGCNLSLNRTAREAIGNFDEHLGAGSPTRSGEDTDYVLRAFEAGYPVHFDPSFEVVHEHGRRNLQDLRDIRAAYAMGNGAILAKFGRRHPWLLRFLWQDLRKSVGAKISGQLQETPRASAVAMLRWYLAGALQFCRYR